MNANTTVKAAAKAISSFHRMGKRQKRRGVCSVMRYPVADPSCKRSAILRIPSDHG